MSTLILFMIISLNSWQTIFFAKKKAFCKTRGRGEPVTYLFLYLHSNIVLQSVFALHWILCEK
jgi:hypothetical protein